MNQSDPIEPQIKDRTERPRGVMPKNAQAIVLGTLALVIVLIVFFSSGSTTPKEHRNANPAPAAVGTAPNSATIDDFVSHIDEQAQKAAKAKADLEKQQDELLKRQ